MSASEADTRANTEADRVHALVDRITATWNAGDAAAYADLFTEDADYVTFFGLHLQGRQAIEAAHRGLFEGPLKGSRLGAASSGGGRAELRFLRPDVAVVICTGGTAIAGAERSAPDRDSTITLTAVKDDAGWRFASFQNTRQSGPAR